MLYVFQKKAQQVVFFITIDIHLFSLNVNMEFLFRSIQNFESIEVKYTLKPLNFNSLY
jgi:hypothetical protein